MIGPGCAISEFRYRPLGQISLPEGPQPCGVLDFERNPRWLRRRRRVLPFPDYQAFWEALMQLGLEDLGVTVKIHPGAQLPHGPYCVRSTDALHVHLPDNLTAAELSKSLWHELEHGRQSLMYASPSAFHAAAAWATVEGERSGLGSWYEEAAQTAELNHYDMPLFVAKKES